MHGILNRNAAYTGMIALIAGTGQLPVHAAQAFALQQTPFFIVSLFPSDNQHALQAACPSVPLIPQTAYKLGAILALLKKQGTKKVLFAGKVDKRLLLKNISLDWLALKLLAKAVGKSDRQLMEQLISFLAEHNIEVISQAAALTPLLLKPSILCGTLSPAIEADIELGLATAQAISLHDIGQTVVVKDRMIIAVEAIEGTDECITRGIALAKEGVVICKAARLDQNKKFDLPTLGPDSIRHLQPGQVAAIAWQSTQTLVIDSVTLTTMAHERGITLVAR